MSRGWSASVVVLLPGVAAATPNPSLPAGVPPPQSVPGPALEISANTTPLALPAIPSFTVAIADGGTHTPHELLVAGERWRGTQVDRKSVV